MTQTTRQQDLEELAGFLETHFSSPPKRGDFLPCAKHLLNTGVVALSRDLEAMRLRAQVAESDRDKTRQELLETREVVRSLEQRINYAEGSVLVRPQDAERISGASLSDVVRTQSASVTPEFIGDVLRPLLDKISELHVELGNRRVREFQLDQDKERLIERVEETQSAAEQFTRKMADEVRVLKSKLDSANELLSRQAETIKQQDKNQTEIQDLAKEVNDIFVEIRRRFVGWVEEGLGWRPGLGDTNWPHAFIDLGDAIGLDVTLVTEKSGSAEDELGRLEWVGEAPDAEGTEA